MTPASRLEDLFTAARMYYGQSQTMEAIAGELGVSRSTVSRMLRDAREAGLVQITLRPPEAHRVEDLDLAAGGPPPCHGRPHQQTARPAADDSGQADHR